MSTEIGVIKSFQFDASEINNEKVVFHIEIPLYGDLFWSFPMSDINQLNEFLTVLGTRNINHIPGTICLVNLNEKLIESICDLEHQHYWYRRRDIVRYA